MGHYWSEMRDDTVPEKSPLEKLGFQRVDPYNCHGQYFHRPCGQMFYFGWIQESKLAKKHAKKCKEK